MKNILTLIAGLFLLTACSSTGTTETETTTRPNTEDATTDSENNNTIGAPEQESTGTSTTTFEKIKEDDRYIYYDGTVTLSGRYYEHHPNSLLGGLLCFEADEATGHLVPRPEGDNRDRWFCFDDQEEAKQLFEINDQEIFVDESVACIEGEATIEISNYVVDTLESEVFDKATLERIVSKGTYSECES